ncbi:hypothetical protein HDU93_002349 [Gonapodya sp. JEL0774]|nr:hypothetical protein HDU93_002349 [Gonapodya sp. JEL0774]
MVDKRGHSKGGADSKLLEPKPGSMLGVRSSERNGGNEGRDFTSAQRTQRWNSSYVLHRETESSCDSGRPSSQKPVERDGTQLGPVEIGNETRSIQLVAQEMHGATSANIIKNNSLLGGGDAALQRADRASTSNNVGRKPVLRPTSDNSHHSRGPLTSHEVDQLDQTDFEEWDIFADSAHKTLKPSRTFESKPVPQVQDPCAAKGVPTKSKGARKTSKANWPVESGEHFTSKYQVLDLGGSSSLGNKKSKHRQSTAHDVKSGASTSNLPKSNVGTIHTPPTCANGSTEFTSSSPLKEIALSLSRNRLDSPSSTRGRNSSNLEKLDQSPSYRQIKGDRLRSPSSLHSQLPSSSSSAHSSPSRGSPSKRILLPTNSSPLQPNEDVDEWDLFGSDNDGTIEMEIEENGAGNKENDLRKHNFQATYRTSSTTTTMDFTAKVVPYLDYLAAKTPDILSVRDGTFNISDDGPPQPLENSSNKNANQSSTHKKDRRLSALDVENNRILDLKAGTANRFGSLGLAKGLEDGVQDVPKLVAKDLKRSLNDHRCVEDANSPATNQSPDQSQDDSNLTTRTMSAPISDTGVSPSKHQNLVVNDWDLFRDSSNPDADQGSVGFQHITRLRLGRSHRPTTAPHTPSPLRYVVTMNRYHDSYSSDENQDEESYETAAKGTISFGSTYLAEDLIPSLFEFLIRQK